MRQKCCFWLLRQICWNLLMRNLIFRSGKSKWKKKCVPLFLCPCCSIYKSAKNVIVFKGVWSEKLKEDEVKGVCVWKKCHKVYVPTAASASSAEFLIKNEGESCRRWSARCKCSIGPWCRRFWSLAQSSSRWSAFPERESKWEKKQKTGRLCALLWLDATLAEKTECHLFQIVWGRWTSLFHRSHCF